jgi:diguanylate cyclase (GGDEF)-like protein/PAS domain S-box-containing protein
MTSLETLMLAGNGPLVRDWLDNLNGSHGIIETKIFNLEMKEAFTDTSTIEKVNKYIGASLFHRQSEGVISSITPIHNMLIAEVISKKSTETLIQGNYFSIAMPIVQSADCQSCHGYDGHDLRGVLSITVDRQNTENRIALMRVKLWVAAALVSLVLGFGLFYLLRKGILAPLSELSEAIIRVATGERSVQLPVTRDDELGVVARLFNSMQGHIEESEARIRAVMDNVLDAVLILDSTGNIEAANPYVYQLFGYMPGEIVGKHISLLMAAENHHDEGVRYLSKQFFEAMSVKCGPIREDVGLKKGYGVIHVDVSMSEMQVAENLHYVVTFRDATLRVEQMQVLKHLALHDPLTGLPNRTLLTDRLQQAVTVCEREESHFSLMFMDLDRFKEVNDSLGHYIGDELLSLVSDKVQSVVRRSDTVARLGGDEFAVLLPGMNAEMAKRSAEKILAALEDEVLIEGNAINVGASIGIAVYPDHGADQVAIMQHADVAMYIAKREKLGYFVYDSRKDAYAGRS